MKKIIIVILFWLIGCSSHKEEIIIANRILSDENIVTKKIDLINKASASIDYFPELNSYLAYKDFFEKNSLYMGVDFKFEQNYNFPFSKEDVEYIQKTIKQDFSWKNKIDNRKITLVERPIYKSNEEESLAVVDEILKGRPLTYLSKPYFNKNKDKAIISFYSACNLCNRQSYFLIKENKKWKIVGSFLNGGR